MSIKTTVTMEDGRISVSTGELRTVWRAGDDRAAASQVASLQRRATSGAGAKRSKKSTKS